MSYKPLVLVALVVAWAISVAYLSVFGIDWGFAVRSSTLPSAIFTNGILSMWAAAPYLMLLPMAQREERVVFTILSVLVVLAFGLWSMDRGRHTPGHESGSYIVVPVQQMMIAAVILLGWGRIRGPAS